MNILWFFNFPAKAPYDRQLCDLVTLTKSFIGFKSIVNDAFPSVLYVIFVYRGCVMFEVRMYNV